MPYIDKSRQFDWRLPDGRTLVGGHTYVNTAPTLVPDSQHTHTWQRSGEVEDTLREDRKIFYNGFQAGSPVTDKGHPFLTTRTSSWVFHEDAWVRYVASTGQDAVYRGPLLPNVFSFMPNYIDPITGIENTRMKDPFPAVPADLDAVQLGATAISRCYPTDPHANTAQALGELLLEGLPSMIGRAALRNKIQVFRSAGSEYLNYTFGWVPFYRDLMGILTALLDASKHITQFARDDGKRIRRRYNFRTDLTVKNDPPVFASGGPLWTLGAQPLVYDPERFGLLKTVRTTRAVWFSGAFQYALPVPDGTMEKLMYWESLANHLLGTRVTPEVLWEIAPWSWLIDWFTNIGDVMAGATALQNDGLVILYGYLMVKTKEEVTWSTTPGLMYKTGKPAFASVVFTRTTKRRVRASPFGFGVEWPDFTAKQIAILAALGLSRT